MSVGVRWLLLVAQHLAAGENNGFVAKPLSVCRSPLNNAIITKLLF